MQCACATLSSASRRTFNQLLRFERAEVVLYCRSSSGCAPHQIDRARVIQNHYRERMTRKGSDSNAQTNLPYGLLQYTLTSTHRNSSLLCNQHKLHFDCSNQLLNQFDDNASVGCVGAEFMSVSVWCESNQQGDFYLLEPFHLTQLC